MYSFRLFFRNSSFLLAGGGLSSIFALIQGIFTARYLGSSGYGEWGLITSICGFIQAFLSFRTQDALTKYLANFRSQNNQESLRILIGAGVLVDALTMTTSFFLIQISATYLSLIMELEPDVVIAIKVLSFTLPCAMLDRVWECLVRDQLRFELLAKISVILSIIQLLGIVFMVYTGTLTLINMALFYVLLALLKLSYYFLFISDAIHNKLKIGGFTFVIKKAFLYWWELKEFLLFLKSGYVASVFSTFVKNADLLILGVFCEKSEIGFYRLAKTMASTLQLLNSSMTSVIYQEFVNLTPRTWVSVKKNIIRFVKSSALISFLLLLLSFMFAKNIISFLYGPSFDGSENVFNIMMIGVCVSTIFFWGQPLLLSQGGHRAYKYTIMIGSICVISLMFLMTFYFGVYGMSWATTLFWIFMPTTITLNAIFHLKNKVKFC